MSHSPRPERWVILVHPGSLCGAVEVRLIAAEQLDDAAAEMERWLDSGASLAVVSGELDFATYGHRRIRALLDRATFKVRGPASAEGLVRAAGTVARRMNSGAVLVTGAWAEPDGGCAAAVAIELKRLRPTSSVALSEFAPACEVAPTTGFRAVPIGRSGRCWAVVAAAQDGSAERRVETQLSREAAEQAAAAYSDVYQSRLIAAATRRDADEIAPAVPIERRQWEGAVKMRC